MLTRVAANQINLALFRNTGNVGSAQAVLDNLSTVAKQAALRAVIGGADPDGVAAAMVDAVLH